MFNFFKAEQGGYREVLAIATPLILSTASLTLMLFVDRMFLAWYSQSAVAAATPGGITYFTICSFFMGTAQYVNTLVAQFHGAAKKPSCARAVWQGIWFSVASAPIILASISIGNRIFEWSGHGPNIVQMEKDFFSILMVGGILLPLNASLSSFFSGRGKTITVMWGNVAGNVANGVLDYCLIFGNFGFPEMGIRGAGLATAVTGLIPMCYWGCLFLSGRYQSSYATRKQYGFDKKLFLLLLRYGIPAGLQFFLDVASFTLFVLLIGRLGEMDLAVTNIVLAIEMLSFLPMVGMSIATSTMVGEYIGQNRYSIAEKSVNSALTLAISYTAVLAVLYMFVPQIFLELFKSREYVGSDIGELTHKGSVLLRMVALYTIFDTLFIIYSGALKGAGDTVFAMWAQIIMAWFFFVPPVYFILEYLKMGLYAAWTWTVIYVILLGIIFWLRFRSGYWKTLRIIEQVPS